MNLHEIEFPAFEPHPLLRHPYAMTAFEILPRRRNGLSGESRIVRVDESTSVRVEIDRPPARPRVAIVLVHGLVGSSESPYMIGTATKAVRAGFLVARLNARNCGGTEELTRTAYHGGLTAEIEATARNLVERDGVNAVHLAGFSIGGNMVLQLAAEWGDSAPSWASSATAVSPCVDFDASSRLLERGLFRYAVQRRFLRELSRIVLRRHTLDGGAFSLQDLARTRTMREFDDRFTAPMSGFASMQDYYSRASALPRLGSIRLPTLLIAAQDDPLVPFAAFQSLQVRDNAALRLLAPERGGHIAFVSRRAAQGRSWEDLDRMWAENRIVQLAAACAELEPRRGMG